MAQEPATEIMQCDHCGTRFKGNPRSQPLGRANYCSIACEEGRGPVPMDDPSSPDYHLHLKGNPKDLVGRALVASGLKLVDYSPDWAKGPDDWKGTTVVSHDEENETYVRKDSTVVGHVVDYGADGYTIEHHNLETVAQTERVVHEFMVVEQLKEDRWWVDG